MADLLQGERRSFGMPQGHTMSGLETEPMMERACLSQTSLVHPCAKPKSFGLRLKDRGQHFLHKMTGPGARIKRFCLDP